MALQVSSDGTALVGVLAYGSISQYSYCGWFNCSSLRSFAVDTVFCIDDGTNSDTDKLRVDANGSTLALFTESGSTNLFSVSTGTWYFVAVSKNGAGGDFWYRAAGSPTLSHVTLSGLSSSTDMQAWRIGRSAASSEYMNGRFAAFKLWNEVNLTEAEFQSESDRYAPQRTTNLLAWYPLHDISVSPPVDYSGNAQSTFGGGTDGDGPPIGWGPTPPRSALSQFSGTVASPATVDYSTTLYGSTSSITTPSCVPDAIYDVEVDWDNDGSYADAYDNVSDDLLMRAPVKMGYGRDDARALLPLAAGWMTFELCDTTGKYDDGNASSPLVDNVIPGRPARLTVLGPGYGKTLFDGYLDSIDYRWNRVYTTVPVRAVDAFTTKLRGAEVTIDVQWGITTGDAIGLVLDAIGWPSGARQIDSGATTIPWYWEERTSALTAIKRLVASEGPPSIAYIDPSTGDFVFEDRHHRLFRARSQTSQATFCVDIPGCTTESPCPTGAIPFTDPFSYTSTRKNIINHAQFTVDVREAGTAETIWSTDDRLDLSSESTTIRIDTQEPFVNATATAETTGPGTLDVSLDRTSGRSATITLTATGAVHIQSIAVTAQVLNVAYTRTVEDEDATSITAYGRSTYAPADEAPWMSLNDAADVASGMVTRWKQRTPIVRVRVANCDATVLAAIIDLVVGDRVTIINQRIGLNAEFHIERIERELRGRGKVHAVTFACEQVFELEDPSTVFRFDTSGQGFDDGVFGY